MMTIVVGPGGTPLVTARGRRRLGRLGLVVPAALAVAAAVAASLGGSEPVHRLSMASAYASLALLAAALLVGPLQLLRHRPSPPSSDLRRDLGILAAVAGTVHAGLGLQVHLGGHWSEYFLRWSDAAGHRLPRVDAFGWANWTGVAATALLLFLLALSNDRALGRLGAARWKALQRWTYAAAAVVLVHGVLYQLLEKRSLPFVAVLAATAAVVTAVQLAGRRAYRRGSPGAARG
jgi:sulfoxide reductase heme-binding subunit YedZ